MTTTTPSGSPHTLGDLKTLRAKVEDARNTFHAGSLTNINADISIEQKIAVDLQHRRNLHTLVAAQQEYEHAMDEFIKAGA